MTKLYKRIYNEDKSRLQSCDYEDIDFTAGTILCFPGQWAIGKPVENKNEIDIDRYERELFGYRTNSYNKSEVTRHVNGFLKIVERILGGDDAITKNGIKLICSCYRDTADNTITSDFMRKYNSGLNNITELKNDPNFFSGEAAEDAYKAIIPLISKNNKISFGSSEVYSLKGESFTTEEINKNLSQVNLLSFSYGSVHAAMVNNALKKFMTDLGFQDQQIREALGNISLLSIAGPILNGGKDTLYFKSVLFEGKNDKVIAGNVPKYSDTINNKKETPYIEKVSDNVLRVILTNPSDIEYFTYKQAKETAGISDTLNHHRLRFYTSYRSTVDGQSGPNNVHAVMLQNVLNNMVMNRELENITDLLKYSDTFASPKTNSYQTIRRLNDKFIQNLINNSENKIQK